VQLLVDVRDRVGVEPGRHGTGIPDDKVVQFTESASDFQQ
jgi:hypothetical protein